jgi:hypothetical protein
MALEKENFQTVLRAAGETETTQENIQDWFELDEGDPGFQLLAAQEISSVIFFYLVNSTTYIVTFSIYLCSKPFFFLVLGLFFALLILMTFPPN